MTHIHMLSDDIINKIAAGEVIERPASIVKELVENAIDAASDAITIELLDGGCKQIIVKDNGIGMGPADVHTAIKRHATSKIAEADDLFAIHTMGFRGEALAAIAGVSMFSLSSMPRGETEPGSSLRWRGGLLEEERSWRAPTSGTVICVEDLFYNLPVRQKFLKSPLAEFAHILELVQALALAHPDISFQLSNNGKSKLDTFAQRSREETSAYSEQVLRARTAEVWGPDFATQSLYISEGNQYGTLTALISPPGLEKQTSRNTVFIVNGRFVKDKILRYGLQRGYHSHLLKGSYPQILCFLQCDPALIDVNVHPAKTELRFQYPSEVQGLLARAIRNGLRSASWTQPVVQASPRIDEELPEINQDAEVTPSNTPEDRSYSSSASKPFFTPRPFSPATFDLDLPTPPAWKNSRQPLKSAMVSIRWDTLQLMGSLFSCYVFLQNDEHVLVVDQHAFHERILYERFSHDPYLTKSRQPMMIAELVQTDIHGIAMLQRNEATLREHGFDFSLQEEGWVEVRGVPTVVAGRDVQKLFTDLTKGGNSEEHAADQHQRQLHHLLATLACHSAVKAGEELGHTEWQALLAAAGQVDFYHNCPHGRRVFKWFSRREVEAWFDRA
jgi:DNA mismatch repair protein MutL